MKNDPKVEAQRLRVLAVNPRQRGDASKPAPVELPKPAERPKPTPQEPDKGKDDAMNLHELMGGARGAALTAYLPRDQVAPAATGGGGGGGGGIGGVLDGLRGGVSGTIGGVDFGIQLPGDPGAPQPSASDPIPPELGAGIDPRTWIPPETDRPSPIADGVLAPRANDEWSPAAIAAAVAAGVTFLAGVGFVVVRWVR